MRIRVELPRDWKYHWSEVTKRIQVELPRDWKYHLSGVTNRSLVELPRDRKYHWSVDLRDEELFLPVRYAYLKVMRTRPEEECLILLQCQMPLVTNFELGQNVHL